VDGTLGAVVRILWIVVPGFVVGVLVMDSVRKIFSEDKTLVRRLFAEQPVTMIATATTLGSVLVWAALRILGLL
jgi:hypothetical protein